MSNPLDRLQQALGDGDAEQELKLERTPEEVRRLLAPAVNYMEISADCTGYSCQNCISLPTGSRCLKPLIWAPVSARHGCCNLFNPVDGKLLFPTEADRRAARSDTK